MRVAIIHDWLIKKAGGEAVLEEILKLYPEADLYTIVDFLDDKERDFVKKHKITTSFVQKLPFAKKKYRGYLALMPLAVEQFDLSTYDLIISSSHAVAKGVITGPDQIHISYVHSPIRYAWDLQHTYLKEAGLTKGIKSFIARFILHYIRIWDFRTSFGVDYFVANSHFIARRVKKVYNRKADVIYPPVSLSDFTLEENKDNFYLTASRMVPYKKVPLIVEAFAKMPDKKLLVIGEGPEYKNAKAVAGPNVEFLGYQSREDMIKYMQKAKAFVFAAEEDFGIVPVEAQGCGTPVIAYGKGGATESVIDGKTGLFFKEQTTQDIIDAVKRFESSASSFSPQTIRENALRFSTNVFIKQFKDFVDHAMKDKRG